MYFFRTMPKFSNLAKLFLFLERNWRNFETIFGKFRKIVITFRGQFWAPKFENFEINFDFSHWTRRASIYVDFITKKFVKMIQNWTFLYRIGSTDRVRYRVTIFGISLKRLVTYVNVVSSLKVTAKIYDTFFFTVSRVKKMPPFLKSKSVPLLKCIFTHFFTHFSLP